MKNGPLVSIITIVYNGERHIADTIRSVQRQTYRNIEYLVIDGGSTDGTIGIIQQFGDTVSVLVSEKDEGISDAFNKGLRRATGEIVGMINADDWYEEDAVEIAVSNLQDADVVYGDLRLWSEGRTDFIVKGDHRYLNKEMTVNHPTVFVRKTCYDQLGFFDKSYKCAMDYDLMLRLLVNNFRFKYISAVLANMRWEGLSDTQWMLGCRETLAIKNKHFPRRKLLNRLYFYKHVAAIGVPKILKKFGLGFLTRVYRSSFARVRKVYE
jgi:glycosyltransferase involved in cell wall biosynthesis